MINKRLLIKNLLAHNDENSFYDKKRQLNLDSKEGKAKLLKHICALSNSNPKNNSFIVIGIDDTTNEIIGTDFFDDAKLQNLINAYLTNAPIIQYENIPFPHLKNNKVVGLVTIKPQEGLTSLRKNIWKYYGGSVFFRDGSISMPKAYDIHIKDVNSHTVSNIEKLSSNSIEHTIESVLSFMHREVSGLENHYKVFKEQYVICWSGVAKHKNGKTYYSRVDIELVSENVKLFYSAKDEVEILVNDDTFTLIEYVQLGIGKDQKYYPLERQTLQFFPNGTYTITTKMIFNPPYYNRKTLHHLYNSNLALLHQLKSGKTFNKSEIEELKLLPETMLICAFNNVGEPMQKTAAHRSYLKNYPEIYQTYKRTLRIIRKIKYQS